MVLCGGCEDYFQGAEMFLGYVAYIHIYEVRRVCMYVRIAGLKAGMISEIYAEDQIMYGQSSTALVVVLVQGMRNVDVY
ncbi:hypothetical protein BJY01DRAFT_219781 [Aspergillus pseudoustus]|uniref:Uncharacterized protein n=1 Tax=Aspergillus pseudoustus TaxID=1810923 RepID=A0ABR4JFT3_9EURO